MNKKDFFKHFIEIYDQSQKVLFWLKIYWVPFKKELITLEEVEEVFETNIMAKDEKGMEVIPTDLVQLEKKLDSIKNNFESK